MLGLSNGAAPSAMDESCQENVNNVSVPLSSEDYLRKYVEILTDEQRTSYKNDFNAEYDEYKMLSEKTSDRTKIFRDLNAKMKSTEDVDEYEVRAARYFYFISLVTFLFFTMYLFDYLFHQMPLLYIS